MYVIPRWAPAIGLLCLSSLASAQCLVPNPVGAAGDFFGAAVEHFGGASLVGTNAPDIAVGAPGAARVDILDACGALKFSLFGAPGSAFGFDLDASLDLNGDGVADLIVGAPSGPGGGAVSAFDIRAGGTLIWTLASPTGAGSNFGWNVRGIVDLNANGTPDVIVGAPTGTVGVANTGYVLVIDGATIAGLWLQTGPATGAEFGWDTEVVGDVDGDGLPDILIGAPSRGVAGGVGAVGIFISNLLFSGAPPFSFAFQPGLAPGTGFGFRVAAIPSLTGGVLPDVIVGAPFAANLFGAPNTGAAHTFNGSALTPITIGMSPGIGGAFFGFSLAPHVSVAGSPTPEVLVGAPGINQVFALDVAAGATVTVGGFPFVGGAGSLTGASVRSAAALSAATGGKYLAGATGFAGNTGQVFHN